MIIIQKSTNTLIGALTFGHSSVPRVAYKYVAQSTTTLKTVQAGLALVSATDPAANDSIQLQIYSGGTDPENGSVLVSSSQISTVELETLPDGDTQVLDDIMQTFVLNSEITLTSGTTYWFVFSRTGALVTTHYPEIAEYSDLRSYSQGWYLNGSTWTQRSNQSWQIILSSPGNVLPTYNPSLISAIGSPQQGLAFPKFVMGGRGGASGTTYALFKKSSSYGFNIFRTEVFHVGRPFYVKEVGLTLHTELASQMKILPVLWFDNKTNSSTGKEINNSNYPDTAVDKNINLRPDNFYSGVKGQFNFFLELQFLGTALCPVTLPILINIVTE